MSILRTLLCLAALPVGVFAQAPAEPAPKAAPAFPLASIDTLRDPAITELFASLPLQEDGRVKPMETFARFRLLRFFGKQHIVATDTGSSMAGMGQPNPVPVTDPATGKPIVTASGGPVDLSAVEWMLISLFRPDIARTLPVFVVDNSEAVQELNLPGKGKRDHYSMNELNEGKDLLMKKMQELRTIKTKDQTPVQRSLSKLAIDSLEYEIILSHFNFARSSFTRQGGELPPDLAGFVKDGHADWAGLLPAMMKLLKEHPEQGAPRMNPWMGEVMMDMFAGKMSGNEEAIPRLFPPAKGESEVWQNPGTMIENALNGKAPTAHELSQLNLWGSILAKAGDPVAFKTALTAFSSEVNALGTERGETNHIGLERHLHRADYFTNALYLFFSALLLLGVSWIKPASALARWSRRLCALLLVSGAVLCVICIVIRCIIMGRPPITSLYETIINITTFCVIFALLAEWIMKRGIALAIAAVIGTLGMFLQLGFMNFEGRDTLEPLQAVLMTNFWLATHVVCINLGYAMGMLAAFCSVGYVLMRCMTLIKKGDDLAREFTRLTYAFTCAGLFLSLIGTVLGGIWANYSWGRFWGWDPKENGALLIVLMNLIILHARLGGFIREVGLHCANVFQGMVVGFSWFGTNQLGVGLHAYGAMEGAWARLYAFWGFMTLMMIACGVLSIIDRMSKRSNDSNAAPRLDGPDGLTATPRG